MKKKVIKVYSTSFILLTSCLLISQVLFSQDFVYIQDDKLMLNSEVFSPMVMNYGINFRTNGVEFWAVPSHGYGSTNDIECLDKADCLETIRADMQLLKDLGFNAIRLVGMAPQVDSDQNFFFTAYTSNTVYQTDIHVPMQSTYSTHFELISDVLEIIELVGLKVIFLSNGPIYNNSLESYFISLFQNFANNSTIFAYDLYNEPLYYDKITSDKNQVCQVVTGWKEMIDVYSPNHLLTVGFTNSSEISRWDPNVLPIDFASFHPYGSLETVKNEIYYYGQYIDKPWIIGETGTPADNLTISYNEQRIFAKETLERNVNCGGQGYSWWQYQEVWWGSFLQDHLGLLNHIGITNTSSSNLSVEGTPKPAAQEFVNFANYSPNFNCECMSTFYNYEGFSNHIISGKLIDDDSNMPIAGGVIDGWDSNYNNYTHTFSRPDGYFNLHSNTPLFHLRISAPGMTTESFYEPWSDMPIVLTNENLSTGDIESYNTSSIITISNYHVHGDEVNGGTLSLYAGERIDLGSGFAADKGAVVTIEPKNQIGNFRINAIEYCNSSGAGLQIESDLNYEYETSLAQELNDYSIIITPNPSEGLVTISADREIDNLKIYNHTGQNVKTFGRLNSYTQLDLLSHASGLYLLVFQVEGNMLTKKMVIK